VLFAFLLVLPFQQRFERLDDLDRNVYFAAFISTTLATAALITPTAYHRLRFRERDKERLILISNRLTILGMFLLAVAMTCTVFLITDVLFGGVQAVLVSVGVGLVFVGLWYALPLSAGKLADDD
jgi:hypothetical protein